VSLFMKDNETTVPSNDVYHIRIGTFDTECSTRILQHENAMPE
jgi:hypothetical protein